MQSDTFNNKLNLMLTFMCNIPQSKEETYRGLLIKLFNMLITNKHLNDVV